MGFNKTFGSRAEVFHGNAKKTTGGLMKKDLLRNKHGAIVSKKKFLTAKKEKRLEKHGFLHASDIAYSFEDIEDENASTKIYTDSDGSPLRSRRRRSEPAITDVIETGQKIGFSNLFTISFN